MEKEKSNNLLLLNSQHNNLAEIAFCHQLCFPNSLSGKLGIAYTNKTFEWFLIGDNKFLFYINFDGKVIGYCGGFVSKGVGDGSSSGMLQHAFREAVVGLLKKPWLLFHQEVVEKYPFIFKNLKNKIFKPQISKTNISNIEFNKSRYAGLVVIGVHPDFRGKGVYDQLMNYFFIKSKEFGVEGCALSVKKDNARGIGAYKKFGWEISEEHTKTYVMKKMF